MPASRKQMKQVATKGKNISQRAKQLQSGHKPPKTLKPSDPSHQKRVQPTVVPSKAGKATAKTIDFLPKPDDPDFNNLFQTLIEATPRDQNGFLQAFYDATEIPPDLNERPTNKREAHLSSARIPLSMLEGYHSLPSGHPVWTRLPNEPKAYFEAFRAFLLSPNRSLAQSGNEIDFEVPGFTPYTIREAHLLFYWSDRSRAYDILKPVAAARQREQRLLIAEDAHYIFTQKLLKQFGEEIESRADDSENSRPWEGLKASELVSAISSMIQMQRVSLGLPSHGPKIKNEGFQPTQHAGTERAIRESAQNYLGTHEAGLTPSQKMQQDINRTIAEDPNAAAELQAVALSIMLKARQQPVISDQTHGRPMGYGPPNEASE